MWDEPCAPLPAGLESVFAISDLHCLSSYYPSIENLKEEETMRDLKRAAVREAMNRSERSFGGYSTHALPTRNAERLGDNLPPKVEELVKKLEDKGMEPDKAWPIAWSIYCRYKNNDSPSCKRKPEEYFKGRKR